MAMLRKRPATFSVTVSTAGTRVPLSATNLLTHDFVIQAAEGNTGTIYLGGSNVSSSQYGVFLKAGAVTAVGGYLPGARGQVEFNLADWFVDASASGQAVTVLYYLDTSPAF